MGHRGGCERLLHCAGRVHVGGYSWRSSEDYMTNPYMQSPAAITASSFSLDSGVVNSGNLASIQSSNNSYLVLNPGPVFGTGTPPVRVVVNGTSTLAEPNELCFEVEAKGSSGNLLQRVELWDYVSGAYVLLDERAATLSDSTVHVAAPYDARRFVQPLTQAVRARVSYIAVGPVFAYPWSASIDLTRWEVLN